MGTKCSVEVVENATERHIRLGGRNMHPQTYLNGTEAAFEGDRKNVEAGFKRFGRRHEGHSCL